MSTVSQSLHTAFELVVQLDPTLLSIVGRSLAVSALACALSCGVGLCLGAWLGVAPGVLPSQRLGRRPAGLSQVHFFACALDRRG